MEDVIVRLEEEKDYREVEEITRAAFMAMELKEGYLKNAYGGKLFESDIYNDELNRKNVIEFDRDFLLKR